MFISRQVLAEWSTLGGSAGHTAGVRVLVCVCVRIFPRTGRVRVSEHVRSSRASICACVLGNACVRVELSSRMSASWEIASLVCGAMSGHFKCCLCRYKIKTWRFSSRCDVL